MTVPSEVVGRRILVVEDDFLIGQDFADTLAGMGFAVLGPVGNIDDALHLLSDTSQIDGVVLDLNLGGEMSYPIADLLLKRGVPFVFTTGYDRTHIAERFSEVTRCEKPVNISRMVQALFKS
jgi:DNA-binding NtrC family response regulator